MYDKNGRYYRMNLNKRYRIEKISFVKFKNLDGLEIDFSEKPVTGILGANGLGKSTILACIRCLYQSVNNPRNRKGSKRTRNHAPEYSANVPFGHVFYGNQFVNYSGSEIVAEFSDWNDQKHAITDSGRYSLQGAQRWKPGSTAKPVCPVYYINMESCVPVTEAKNYTADRNRRARFYQHIYIRNVALRNAFEQIFGHTIELQSTNVGGEESLCIKKDNKKFIFRDLSAGEQRVLRLLDVLFTAEDESIVLIDEIEMTLHPYALGQLISVLNKQAKQKRLQIIFTSHNQELIERKDIAVRSLYSSGNQIRCEHGYNQQCVKLLRGNSVEKPFTILMEDEMSKAIITTVLKQMNRFGYANRILFGGYDTAFKLASSLHKVGKLTDKIVFVLDGDVCQTSDEKKSLVGGSGIVDKTDDVAKTEIVKHFIQYVIPEGEESIESYFHKLILAESDVNDRVVQAAMDIPIYTMENIPAGIESKDRFLKHYKIEDTITGLGYDRKEASGYEEVVKHVADNHIVEWEKFVVEVKKWIKINMPN